MENTNRNWSGALKRLGLLAAIVLTVAAVFQFTPLSLKDFTPTNIKNFILGFGAWGPLVFIALYASRAVIMVIPVGIMSFAGGLAYGQWWGTLYILIGATLGSTLSFLVARYFGRNFIEQFEMFIPAIYKKVKKSRNRASAPSVAETTLAEV